MVLDIVQVLNVKLTDGYKPLILYNMEKAVKLQNLFKSFFFPNKKFCFLFFLFVCLFVCFFLKKTFIVFLNLFFDRQVAL